MPLDLNSIATFIAVAQTRSFRAAADQLGVTRSAISQSVRKLEGELGIALLQRTTRSVSLTEAGQQFLTNVAPALSEVRNAASIATDRKAQPSGLLRLAVSSIAENFISGPLLGSFRDAHPQVRLDVLVTDEHFDIVAKGYDAGVRLGEVIEQDMITVPVSKPQRQVVVGSPDYFKRFGKPLHPRDLTSHHCIGWRQSPGVTPYRWEFAEKGRDFDVAVDPEVTTNDMWLMIRTACAGAGLTFGMEETLRPWISRGALVPVLEEYSPTFPGFFLYFPNRRNLAPKLRALVDHVKAWRATRSKPADNKRR